MADIILECTTCGNRFAVSEFVSAEFLTCARCKSPVKVPPRTPEQPLAARLRLVAPKDEAPPPVPTEALPPGDPRRKLLSRQFRRRRVRRAPGRGHLFWPWVLFVGLVIVLGILRFYPGVIPPAQVDWLVKAGITGLLFLHAVIIAYAFMEDAFHGVLCAIVPGYSLYYVFFEVDQFYMRAVMAALLVVFGLDTADAIRRVALESYDGITRWMNNPDNAFRKDRVPGT